MLSFRHKILLMMVFFKAPFFDLCFSCYTCVTLLMMLSLILVSMLVILLCTNFDEAFDLSQQVELASVKVKFQLQDTKMLQEEAC